MTEAAFEEQVMALNQTMYHIACTLLSNEQDRQDAVQECIWKAWKNLPRLRDETLFKAWLLRILMNECKSIWRKKRREILTDPPDKAAEQDLYAQHLQNEALHNALMKLPEKLRLTVTLFYIDGFSLKETAHILRIPAGTAKSRLNQARNKLKNLLESEV